MEGENLETVYHLFQNLLKGNFKKVEDGLQDYLTAAVLAPCQRNEHGLCTDDVWKKRSTYAIKFLHNYAAQLQDMTDSDVLGAVECISLCCTCLKLHPIELSDPLLMHNCLYNILYRATKKDMFIPVKQLVELLIENVENLAFTDNEKASKIIYGSYAAVWNLVAQHDEKTNPMNPEKMQAILKSAITLILYCPGKYRHVKLDDKMTIVVNKLEGLLQRKSVNKEQVLSLTGDYMFSVIETSAANIRLILKTDQVDAGQAVFLLLSVLSLTLRHVEFAASHSRVAQSHVGVSLSTVSKILTSKTIIAAVSPAVVAACKACVALFTSIVQMVNQSEASSPRTSKLLVERIHEAVEAVNSYVSRCSSADGELVPEFIRLVGKAASSTLRHLKTGNGLAHMSRLPELVDNYQDNLLLLHDVLIRVSEHEYNILSAKQDAEKVLEMRKRIVMTSTNKLNSHLQVLQNSDKELADCKETLERSQKDVKKLSAHIDKFVNPDEKAYLDAEEHLYFSNLVYPFGRRCYHALQFEHCITYLEFCCKHINKYHQLTGQAQNSQWRKYELLADAHRRLHQYKSALDAVAQGLKVAPDELNDAMEMWVKFKVEAVKYTEDKDVLEGTLYDAVNISGDFEPQYLLQLELDGYRAKKSKSAEALSLSVLDRMIEYSRSPLDTGHVLTMKAQLLWTSGKLSNRECVELCDQAISTLDGAAGASSGELTTLIADLAAAHMWRHLMSDVDPRGVKERLGKMSKKDEEKKSVNPTVGGTTELSNPAQDSDDSRLFQDCYTIHMETAEMKNADQALELWTKVIKENLSVRCVQSTLENLHVLASVFRLADKVIEEHRCLSLLSQFSKKSDKSAQQLIMQKFYLKAQMLLVNFYCKHRQPALAVTVVKETESWLNKGGKNVDRASQNYYYFLLAKSEALLVDGQVESGWKVLETVIEERPVSVNNRTKEALLLEGYVSFLQARYESLPFESCRSTVKGKRIDWLRNNSIAQSDTTQTEGPIQLYVKSARLISGVLCHLMGGEWPITGRYQDEELKAELINSVERWGLLDVTLRSLLSVGKSFTLVGEEKQARCHLDQGLKITQSFCLPRRFAEFHLALGQLDVMSAKYSDCQAHLNSAHYLLHSPVVPNTGTDKNSFIRLEDVADNSDVTNRSPDNAENFLRGHMINMADELTGSVKTDDPNCSPAVALKRDVKRPGYWAHLTDCSCTKCRDLTSVALDMKYFMLQAQCLIEQGEVTQGEKHWNALVEVSDDLVLQAEQTWARVILNSVQTSYKKKQPKTAHFKALMLELSLMQAEYRLTKNSDTIGMTRCNAPFSPKCGMSVEYWLRQAEKLMDESSSAEIHHQKADLGYLDGVPSLPWPKKSTEMEELCEGIGRVKLVEMNIAQPTVQVSTPVNAHRKPRLNQVKKIYRAKPMVGVQKESKAALAKQEVPTIYISDNSIDDSMDVSTDESILLTSRRTKGAKSESRDLKAKTPAPRSRAKRESGTRKSAESVKISPCNSVTVYNDENCAASALAPKKTGRKVQVRNTKKSESAISSKTRNVSINSKLQPPEVFSPISRILPSSAKKTKETNAHVTPARHSGLSPRDSTGFGITHRVLTPVSCSSKKGKLLKALHSDSDDDDFAMLAPKKSGKVTRGKKPSAASSRITKTKSKTHAAEEVKKEENNFGIPKHVLHEVQNSPLFTTPMVSSKTGRATTNNRLKKSSTLQPKLTNPPKSPVHSLFKESLESSFTIESDQKESVYDFIGSSPEPTPVKSRVRRGKYTTTDPRVIAARSKLSLTARRARAQTNSSKGEDIENVRKQNDDGNDIGIYDFEDCVTCEKENKENDKSEEVFSRTKVTAKKGRKSKPAKSPEPEEIAAKKTKEKVTRRTATRGRLTRATTNVTEATRSHDRDTILDDEYLGGDVSGCYLDSSLVVPDAPLSSDSDSNSPGMLSTDDEEEQGLETGRHSVSWVDEHTEWGSVFTAVCTGEVPAELPDLLLECPAIERARYSERTGGSFGSITLSPANISLAQLSEDSVCEADFSSLDTTSSSSTEEPKQLNVFSEQQQGILQEDGMSSESDIEVFRGGSDEENIKPTKQRGRGKRVTKAAAVVRPDSPDTELPRMSGSLMKLSLSDDMIGSPDLVSCTTPPRSQKGNLERLREELQNVFALIRHHPPALTYRRVCHALAWINLHLEEENMTDDGSSAWESAFYLSEAQGVTFRHNTLCNINRKLRKLDKEKEGSCEGYKEQLLMQSNLLSFGKTVGHVRRIVEELPEDITFCQVCVMKRHEEDAGQMIVVRYEKQRTPVVVKLPGFAKVSGQKILKQMEKVMKTNRETMSITDKVEWWQQRRSADDDLRDLLNDIEHSWLGPWKGLLLGSPSSKEDRECLHEATAQLRTKLHKLSNSLINDEKLQVLLSSSNSLGAEQLVKGVAEVTRLQLDSPALTEAVKLFRETTDSLTVNLDLCDRCPSVLILDKIVQHLPWESIPLLRSRCVSRMPSLHFLHAHYRTLVSDPASVFTSGVDTMATYYILDPEDNLPRTHEKFHSWFSSEKGWKGLSRSVPSNSDYTEAFTNHDLFIYCGHGSGNKFMSGDMLQTFRCRPVCLLIGCSSGKLEVNGRLEATGKVTNYLLAGSPCVLSCNWDVTDRDVDRFTEDLLQLWINKRESPALLQCLAQSRDVCRLPYLIGAAPVVYGLPVHTK